MSAQTSLDPCGDGSKLLREIYQIIHAMLDMLAGTSSAAQLQPDTAFKTLQQKYLSKRAQLKQVVGQVEAREGQHDNSPATEEGE